MINLKLALLNVYQQLSLSNKNSYLHILSLEDVIRISIIAAK